MISLLKWHIPWNHGVLASEHPNSAKSLNRHHTIIPLLVQYIFKYIFIVVVKNRM